LPQHAAAACRPSREKHPVVLTLEIILGITSMLLILFVLLHKGKGGGLSDMFGGGFTSQHGGSSVVEKNLDRITIVLSVIWLASIVGIGIAYK
jgi:preprotein translocase subunit SecG